MEFVIHLFRLVYNVKLLVGALGAQTAARRLHFQNKLLMQKVYV